MRIEVPMLPPASWSPNARLHWAVRHKHGKIYQNAVFYSAIDARNRLEKLHWQPSFPPFTKARLDLTFVFASYRKRDEDNLRARFKPGQDGLVQAGLIPDDSPEHLVMGKVKIEVNKEQAPKTIIDLNEM